MTTTTPSKREPSKNGKQFEFELRLWRIQYHNLDWWPVASAIKIVDRAMCAASIYLYLQYIHLQAHSGVHRRYVVDVSVW